MKKPLTLILTLAMAAQLAACGQTARSSEPENTDKTTASGDTTASDAASGDTTAGDAASGDTSAGDAASGDTTADDAAGGDDAADTQKPVSDEEQQKKPAVPAVRDKAKRPRTIVTTDLECDDACALIHLLLYSNEIDISGIVVTSSTYHWTGDGEHTQAEINKHTLDLEHTDVGNDLTQWRPMDLEYLPELIGEHYASVYPSLSSNDPNFPSPEELMSCVYLGNYEFEGDTRFATDGSDFIMQCLLDDDPRPLYLEAWGGANTVARALMSIEEKYKDTDEWDEVYKKVCSKGILISFGDQDTTYEDYIAVKWPKLGRMYCVTAAYGYGMENSAPLDIQYTFRGDWLKENIKFDHGSLLEQYPLIGDGLYYEGENKESQFGDLETVRNSWLMYMGIDFNEYDFISEGDAPCFMYLIPVGLRGLENSNYGSWGGRMADGAAVPEYDPTRGEITDGYSAHRWLYAYQNDFASRADWCVSSYDDCNHPPVVSAEELDYQVPAGTSVSLKGTASDPDGDDYTGNWFLYKEASSYSGKSASVMDVWAHNTMETNFTVPADAKPGDYFNLVLEVSDHGTPSLTRYAQVIVTVTEPKAEQE